MPKYILGLDISTSITGIVVLEDTTDQVPFDPTKHLVHYEGVELAKHKNFWIRTTHMKEALERVQAKYPVMDGIFVEEPMKRFAVGFSSAQTISILQRMNGIVCYLAFSMWSIDPTYINVTSARKKLGIKIVSRKKDPAGRNAKKQTFDHMLANDLSHIVWPLKRTGTPKDWVSDVVDAYVIGRAGMV